MDNGNGVPKNFWLKVVLVLLVPTLGSVWYNGYAVGKQEEQARQLTSAFTQIDGLTTRTSHLEAGDEGIKAHMETQAKVMEKLLEKLEKIR